MNYVDINSNITKDNVTSQEAIENAIVNILSTNIGSVPGHPAFGSNVTKYLFEILDPLTKELIKTEIKYALERWEDRVRIVKVDVDEDADYNRIEVEMTYTLKIDKEAEESFIHTFVR